MLKYPKHLSKEERARAIKRAYYERNKEVAKKRASDWNRAHKLRRAEICKKHFGSDPKNKISAASRAVKYYWENPDKFRVRSKEWAKLNRAKLRPAKRAHNQKRRAIKKSTSDGTEKEIKAFIISTMSKKTAHCYYCSGRVSSKKIHFDHIKPLSRGGIHSISNICVSCVPCNLAKGSKLIHEWECSMLPL